MAILVCGGAGYIGSHINKQLNKEGYETIIFDNLVYGHREAVKWGTFVRGDLANQADIEAVFSSYKIDAVFHFAAYAYVGESVTEPEKYYYNNVVNTLNLLHVMKQHGCNRIIFSSTCATYGEPERVPITEDMAQNPINPYGRTKLMVEEIFKDYQKAYYGLKSGSRKGYTRCKLCGALIEKTGNKRMYCRKCALIRKKESNKKSDQAYKIKLRENKNLLFPL